MQRQLILSGSDTFLTWTFPQVGNHPLWSLRIRVKQAQRTACQRTQSVSCFSVRTMRIRAWLIVHTVQGSTMELKRGDSKSERLIKWNAVTPHHPAKRPRLLQADQQETELRQRCTIHKWRHNLAVYYAANLHGSCVNIAKSA